MSQPPTPDSQKMCESPSFTSTTRNFGNSSSSSTHSSSSFFSDVLRQQRYSHSSSSSTKRVRCDIDDESGDSNHSLISSAKRLKLEKPSPPVPVSDLLEPFQQQQSIHNHNNNHNRFRTVPQQQKSQSQSNYNSVNRQLGDLHKERYERRKVESNSTLINGNRIVMPPYSPRPPSPPLPPPHPPDRLRPSITPMPSFNEASNDSISSYASSNQSSLLGFGDGVGYKLKRKVLKSTSNLF